MLFCVKDYGFGLKRGALVGDSFEGLGFLFKFGGFCMSDC